MATKEQLKKIIADYKKRKDTASLVVVYWNDGQKAGVSNKAVIQKVIDVLIKEAENQLKEK